jgi:hypothetical protein
VTAPAEYEAPTSSPLRERGRAGASRVRRAHADAVGRQLRWSLGGGLGAALAGDRRGAACAGRGGGGLLAGGHATRVAGASHPTIPV